MSLDFGFRKLWMVSHEDLFGSLKQVSFVRSLLPGLHLVLVNDAEARMGFGSVSTKTCMVVELSWAARVLACEPLLRGITLLIFAFLKSFSDRILLIGS